jgi:hypothetical protein
MEDPRAVELAGQLVEARLCMGGGVGGANAEICEEEEVAPGQSHQLAGRAKSDTLRQGAAQCYGRGPALQQGTKTDLQGRKSAAAFRPC